MDIIMTIVMFLALGLIVFLLVGALVKASEAARYRDQMHAARAEAHALNVEYDHINDNHYMPIPHHPV